MNILRWRRKSKKKIRPKKLLLFIFSLIMTTFAWFAYSKVLDTSLNIHMISWDMEYSISGVEKTNPIAIEIPTLYPTMPEQTVTIDIKNNGETSADIEYHVESVTIIGVTYQLIDEGQAIPTDPTANYFIITPSVYETDATTGKQVVRGAITNDVTKLPFTIEVEYSPQVESKESGYLTVSVNWIGDNHELDSQWGYIVGEYLEDKAEGTPAMTIELAIDSYQTDEDAGTITETLPSTSETTPYLPTGFTRVAGTNLNTGLAIKDSSGNEYVWIEVPKTEAVYTNSKLAITEFTETEYTSIENDLKTYTGTYRNETAYVDNYPSTVVYRAVGLDIDTYTELKQKMLKSIYQNGGFYVGRYETGIAESYRTSATTPTETPVIKADAYPFNHITCAQAQSLASGMASGQYTSSLMFGIQWDLVLKYLETKGVDSSQLNSDSTTLGNYNDNKYYITRSNAKYYDTAWNSAPYEKSEKGNILVSTGASSLFSKQRISDFAGNLWEWTLEYTSTTGQPSAYRGSSYDETETTSSASTRASIAIDSTSIDIGFRVTIY